MLDLLFGLVEYWAIAPSKGGAQGLIWVVGTGQWGWASLAEKGVLVDAGRLDLQGCCGLMLQFVRLVSVWGLFAPMSFLK